MTTVLRRWFCSCGGEERELVQVSLGEDEVAEPTCPRCGATPSSDPGRTLHYRDEEEWDD